MKKEDKWWILGKFICIDNMTGNYDPKSNKPVPNPFLTIGEEYELQEDPYQEDAFDVYNKNGELLTWVSEEDKNRCFISIAEYRNLKIKNILK